MNVNNKKEEGAYMLIHLITFLDGYRVAHCEDPAIIDKKISEEKTFYGSRNIKKLWKSIKKDLYKVAISPMKSPNVARLVKIQSVLRMIETIMLVLTALLAFLGFSLHIPEKIIPILLIVFFISFSSAFLLEKILGRKIATEIGNFYKTHPSKFETFFKRLKIIVQGLINNLNMYIDKHKKNPEEIKFGLYNVDYSGIKIIKKPSLTRNYFLVIPSINKK